MLYKILRISVFIYINSMCVEDCSDAHIERKTCSTFGELKSFVQDQRQALILCDVDETVLRANKMMYQRDVLEIWAELYSLERAPHANMYYALQLLFTDILRNAVGMNTDGVWDDEIISRITLEGKSILSNGCITSSFFSLIFQYASIFGGELSVTDEGWPDLVETLKEFNNFYFFSNMRTDALIWRFGTLRVNGLMTHRDAQPIVDIQGDYGEVVGAMMYNICHGSDVKAAIMSSHVLNVRSAQKIIIIDDDEQQLNKIVKVISDNTPHVNITAIHYKASRITPLNIRCQKILSSTAVTSQLDKTLFNIIDRHTPNNSNDIESTRPRDITVSPKAARSIAESIYRTVDAALFKEIMYTYWIQIMLKALDGLTPRPLDRR